MKYTRNSRKPQPTAIDLFAGAGGLSLGLEQAGFQILFAADSWPVAVATYHKNFKHKALCVDLSITTGQGLFQLAELERPTVDLVVGGPPCQGFSVQRIGPDQDARNSMVRHFGRLVLEIGPRYFLMENVAGLLGKRGQAELDAFLQQVKSGGFEVQIHTINAADYGVPQVRKRTIILGWNPKYASRPELPKPSVTASSYRTVMDAIGDLVPPSQIGMKAIPDPLHKATKLSPLNLQRLKHIPPGGGMQNLPVALRANCHKAGADKIGHRYVYGRLALDAPAATITARFDSFTRGKFAHPTQDRNITLREGARLQTFPDSYQFTGNQEEIAAQIGNAVPPQLAKALLETVRTASERTPTRPSGTSNQVLLFAGK